MPKTKEQTEQIRAESREKILSTARRLFAARGFNGCNVSDIAREAGMSQGNIYWYFPSKKDIYMAILSEGFSDLGNLMAQTAGSSGTALEKLDQYLKEFFRLMREEGGDEFVAIVTPLLAQSGPEGMADFGISTHEVGAGYHASLNAIFSQGQEEGTFNNEVDPNILSTFLFGFTNGLMLMYPDVWRDIPEDILRKAILRLLGASPD